MASHRVSSAALEFRGHGRSGGKPGFVRHWDDHLTDLAALLRVEELRSDPNQPPLFLFSHSHGGLVAAVAAMRGLLPNIRGVILSAPYFDLKMPIPAWKYWLATLVSAIHPSMQIRSGVRGPMLTRDPAMIDDSRRDPFIRGIATPRWFFETCQTQIKTRATAVNFKMPLLMLVPGNDSIANPQASLEFFKAAGSADKTLLHYPDHMHELVREIGRDEIFQQILNWMQQRLSAHPIPVSAL
jgi:alpha-beta hydrolase superfamily lysophospholipase